jgi:hypothetical protein
MVNIKPPSNNFNYHAYPRFVSLIAFDGDSIVPKQKSLPWLMRMVEDIYDHRFSYEDRERDSEEEFPEMHSMLQVFPIFSVKKVGTDSGLKTLVDQTCWDLLFNTHRLREEHLEVELFARFLQEFYDQMDLLFFLYVRSVLAKVLHVHFKARWAASGNANANANGNGAGAGSGGGLSGGLTVNSRTTTSNGLQLKTVNPSRFYSIFFFQCEKTHNGFLTKSALMLAK